jgi:hypothetical protein
VSERLRGCAGGLEGGPLGPPSGGGAPPHFFSGTYFPGPTSNFLFSGRHISGTT